MAIDATQRVNLWHHHHIFYIITVIDHKLGGVFCPHVDAIAPFTRSFQCRTIHTIGTTVVLPSKVVLSLWMERSVAENWEIVRRPFPDGIGILTTFSDIGTNEQFTIRCQLAGNIKSGTIEHTKAITACSQPQANRIKRQLDDLFTILISRVSHLNAYLGIGICRQTDQQATKQEPTTSHFNSALKWLMA